MIFSLAIKAPRFIPSQLLDKDTEYLWLGKNFCCFNLACLLFMKSLLFGLSSKIYCIGRSVRLGIVYIFFFAHNCLYNYF